MTGCVFKRKLASGKTTWGYSIDVGRDADGKRRRKFKSGFARKGDAAAALRDELNKLDKGESVAPDPQTFEAWAERWFQQFAPRRCTPKTLERYRQLVAYALPHIGPVKLQDLSALMIEPALFKLLESGGHNRKTKEARPLSAKTVRHIASVLDVILKAAVKKKLRESNPMAGVELPKVEPTEAAVLDADQLSWYLDVSRSFGLYEMLLFAAATGCRRGEVLALTWADIDLDAPTVAISKSLEQTRNGLRVKSTKNRRSRVLTLPRSVVEVLRTHRQAQDKNRALFSEDYRSDLDLVFCDSAGGFLKPDTVTAKACLVARKAGLQGVSLHTLRHSHASQLISEGRSTTSVSNAWAIRAWRRRRRSTHTPCRKTTLTTQKPGTTCTGQQPSESLPRFPERGGWLHMVARLPTREG